MHTAGVLPDCIAWGRQSKRNVDESWTCSTQTVDQLPTTSGDKRKSLIVEVSPWKKYYFTKFISASVLLELIHVLALNGVTKSHWGFQALKEYLIISEYLSNLVSQSLFFYCTFSVSCANCWADISCILLINLSLSLLPFPSVMLLDTTESTSELGWTTYPDTGVSK